MSEEKKVLEYDEDDSVKFIQSSLPDEMKGEFSDDDINYIVDLIYEYYEEKGFLEESDEDTDVEINETELLDYVIKNAKRDNIRKFSEQEIDAIIQGELLYCDSLDLFE